MALDPFLLEDTVYPETIQACLLDRNDPEVLSGSRLRLSP
jgi:hypothetical protein